MVSETTILMSVTPQKVLQALSSVQDPDLNKDIVSLGFIKDLTIKEGQVSFSIELTTPACPVKDLMKRDAEKVVNAIDGVSGLNITMTSRVRNASASGVATGLALSVKNIVPIASGKGGVGKSTVSANLARALSNMGAHVGLMDADVYGPSIPTILGISDGPKIDQDKRIIPVEIDGVKVISMGFFMKPDEAVVWRGPMLHKAVQQFLGDVNWGELDYLLVDLPPGTGDVQISLCQTIPITGAVIVSTPQDVALNVAQKAIVMFDKLKVPTIGVIENMSYYICPHCGEKDHIFGDGGVKKISERLNIPFLGQIPLSTPVRSASDAGESVFTRDTDSAAVCAFNDIAKQLASQLSIRAVQGSDVSKSI